MYMVAFGRNTSLTPFTCSKQLASAAVCYVKVTSDAGEQEKEDNIDDEDDETTELQQQYDRKE